MSLTDHTAPSDAGVSVAQANPSVSKSQWVNYALRKLREGYVVLETASGRAFHFYRVGEPMQPCAPHAAKKLIAMGMLVPQKSDVRGTTYALREAFQAEEPAA